MVGDNLKILITLVWLCCCVVSETEHISVEIKHYNQQVKYYTYISDSLVSLETHKRYQKRATESNVAITGNSIIITAPIYIGASKQMFTVLLDTGSPLLALPTAGCACDTNTPNSAYNNPSQAISCSQNDCRACCDASVCPTGQCSFSIAYAGGSSINGSLYSDTVTLGVLSANMLFGGITQESQNFVAPYADGIMGFSQNGDIACSPTCVPPIFTVFASAGLVRNSFGIFLSEGGAGELSLGADENSLGLSFVFVPLLETTNFYRVGINSFLVGTTQITNTRIGILDTGTTLITLPTAVYTNLQNHFQNNLCDLAGACGSQNIFNNNCLRRLSDVLLYPNLTFEMAGNVGLSVPPSAYFLPTSISQSETVYCLGIGSWSDDSIILGYSFMRGYYILYDMEDNRIGFYSNSTTTTTSSSSIVVPSCLSFLLFLCLFSISLTV